jgi:hypothetical protein
VPSEKAKAREAFDVNKGGASGNKRRDFACPKGEKLYICKPFFPSSGKIYIKEERRSN